MVTVDTLAKAMSDKRSRPRRDALAVGTAVVYASLVAVLVERLTAVAGDLQLWADGAWFLVRIASTRNYYFWIGDWKKELFRSRLFTILADQTPTVLATHLPIHSLHALSIIFGITLYSHALLSLYLCYRFTPRRWYMLFPLLSFFAGTMNVEAYLSTDSHFIVSLYWPLLFLLLFCTELRRGTMLLLIALSVPTILSYESVMFFGLILAGVCLWRRQTLPAHRALMIGLAVWYLAGAAMAAAATIWPFDPSNRAGFLHALLHLLHSSHLAAQASLLILLCCALLLLLPTRMAALQKVVAAVGVLNICYLCVAVLLGRTPSSLEVEVQARVLNLLLPLAATALLFVVLAGWSKPNAKAIGLTAVLIGGLGIGQVLWNLAAIMRWQGMVATLRYELQLHEGPVAFEDSIMSRQQLGPLRLRELHAHWPLLPLSLYEAGRGQVRSIILPESGAYFPFDPFAPATLPDLSRYGVGYESYRKALERNWHYAMGQTLTFQRGGSAAPFLRGQWADAETWATWGSGPDFGLDLPVSPGEVKGDATLWALVAPNLSPDFPQRTVEVLVNKVPVGSWQFKFSADPFTTRTLPIPKAVLGLSNPVQITFHVVGPLLSPTEMGTASDPRKLSLAFLKLRLQVAAADPRP